MEKIIRAAQIEIDGPKLLQAYADDINLAENIVITIKEVFIKMETEATKFGPMMNEEKH